MIYQQNNILLSIITPTLNSEKYLESTINSIKEASNKSKIEIEHIIIDGGSTDQTQKIALESSFSKLHVLPNSTMYEAIDFGFKKSSGEWLCWINSDDLYFDYTFKEIEDLIANEEVSLITGDTIYIGTNGNRLYGYNYSLTSYFFLKSFNHLLLSQPSTFWRREIYDKIGGLDLSYKLYADRHLYLRMIKENKLYKVRKPLTMFRIHGKNLSIVKSKEGEFEDKRINKELEVGRINFLNYSISFIGHLILKINNWEMIIWKVKNRKINFFK